MTGFYRCSICQVVSRDIVQHDKHLTGKRHARNVELAVSGAGAEGGGGKHPLGVGGTSKASKASSKRAKRTCPHPLSPLFLHKRPFSYP